MATRSSSFWRAVFFAATVAAAIAAVLAPALLVGCGGSAEGRVAAVMQTAGAQADGNAQYADAMAREHAGDRPTPSPAATAAPDTAVTGRAVTYGRGLTGYLAVPERVAAASDTTGAALPAIIAAHEWWGLNDNIRQMARRLAGQGYRVLAVDFYGGQVAETPGQARQLMQEATADREAMRGNVEAAYEHLTAEHGAPQVGIIGWCFGGGVSLSSALAMPRSLGAAVIYYGSLEGATREALEPVEVPIIGFFGAEDQGIPVEEARQFEETLDALGKEAEVYIYDEAGHAFANPSGQNYVPSAAEDAWQKTTAFLEKHLKE